MIAALLFAAVLSTPPTPAPPTPGPAVPDVLSSDPADIARSQFIAFALDRVNPSFYADAPDRAKIAEAQRLILQTGRIKRIELFKRYDSRYGTGYAYRFSCEHGTLIERFTLKAGKITSISFDTK